MQHCAPIILNATSRLLNSLFPTRLQLLSLIAAWPRMTQPRPANRFPNLPVANRRALTGHQRANAESHIRQGLISMILPLEALPLLHILTVLLAGAIGFYLLHRFAQ